VVEMVEMEQTGILVVIMVITGEMAVMAVM
jgi:hypothetical protein